MIIVYCILHIGFRYGAAINHGCTYSYGALTGDGDTRTSLKELVLLTT